MKEKFYIVIDEKTGKCVTASNLFFRIYADPPSNLALAYQPGITEAIHKGDGTPIGIDINQAERWYVRPAVMTRPAATELVANYREYIRSVYLVKNGNVTRPALKMVRVIVHGDKLAKYIRY